MDYYSAIKKNTFESVLMKRGKYCVLTHFIESRKMVLMNLFAGQQWRHRHREQICDTGGRTVWDELREFCGNVYITIRKIVSGNLLYNAGS